MNARQQARRERVWKRYVLFGESREDVIAAVADDFDVTEATVEEDLQSISEWLPDLDIRREVSGVFLLAELRVNRQRLHQLAEDASDEDDITAERKIREEINRSIDLERRLAESKITTEKPVDEVDQMLDSGPW